MHPSDSNIEKIDEISPWYRGGLPFKCTGCGKCCTGASGYVWVNEEEIKKICQHLQVPFQEFCRDYLSLVEGQWTLREMKITEDRYDCIFLDGKRCMIYSIRPVQCQTFPWWPSNLQSEQRWQETANECEGIHSQAPMVPFEQIQESLKNLQQARKSFYRGI